jgi:hypothetical protein
MSKNVLKDRIKKTVCKNSSNGLWVDLKKLKVEDCKIGDIVLTFSGSVFEIEEIEQNANRSLQCYLGGSHKFYFP